MLDVPAVSLDLEKQVMDAFYDVELETGEVITPLIYPKAEWMDRYSLTPLFETIQKEGVRVK